MRSTHNPHISCCIRAAIITIQLFCYLPILNVYKNISVFYLFMNVPCCNCICVSLCICVHFQYVILHHGSTIIINYTILIFICQFIQCQASSTQPRTFSVSNVHFSVGGKNNSKLNEEKKKKTTTKIVIGKFSFAICRFVNFCYMHLTCMSVHQCVFT